MNYLEFFQTALSFMVKPDKRKLIWNSFHFNKLNGLEIGGPSDIFKLKGYFPVYLFASKIDGVNFSNETVWEGTLKQGNNYNYYKNKFGYQYIAEATNLGFIEK